MKLGESTLAQICALDGIQDNPSIVSNTVPSNDIFFKIELEIIQLPRDMVGRAFLDVHHAFIRMLAL